MKNAENTITYIEFPAADRERLYAAQAFYGAAFGWHYRIGATNTAIRTRAVWGAASA